MPTAPTLPAGTSLGFSYEYGVDINTGTVGSPAWQPIRRISAVAPSVTPITSDAQTYDDFGAPNDQKTSESWSLAFSVLVNRLTSGLYSDEVEKLKAYTEPDAVGTSSIAHVRWYDKPVSGTANAGEAYEGFAYVSIERAKTGNAETGTWSVTLTGQGKRTKIANPFTGWAVTAPTIASVLPALAAVDSLVTITGSQFTGVTAVTIDAALVLQKTVVSPSTIIALVPATVSGAASVIVTNGVGASAAYPYVAA